MSLMDLTALRRRYVAVCAFGWLGTSLVIPVMVLQMSSKGLDLATIGLVFLVHGLVVTGLELPTGGLADVIGRRGVLAASAALGMAGLLWMAFAGSAWEFVAITAIRGVARALSSGPAEAWYVDAVHSVDREGDIRKGLSLGSAAGSITLGAGTVLGGVLPLVVPDGSPIPALSVPILLGALGYGGLLLIALLGMPEPARETARPKFGELFRAVPGTIVTGLKLGVRNKIIAQVLACMAIVGIALDSVELLTPGRMADLLGGEAAAASGYGVITMVGFVANALGSGMASRLAQWVGTSARAAGVGAVIGGGGLLVLAATGGLDGVAGLVGTGSGYALMFFGLGVTGPLRSELVHHEVAASERATVVSIQSLAMQAGGSLGVVGLPILVAATSTPVAWLVAGLMLAASALLVRKGRTVARAAIVPAA
ncbi:MFS transporter [Phytomonospora sp. NPDC050363]|uniref:MFS transporter n=1 Tax=Phytomonospora sp. NPDC050363 TaxID=3155642 RepID=UPI0033CEC317